MTSKRTLVKWLHWLSFFLILYFFLIEPTESRADPGGALSTHAGLGVALALVTGVWFLMYLRSGLLGRAGPKLPGWAKFLHRLGHTALHIGVPVMVATGAIAGLAAPFLIHAFGVLPINPGLGGRTLHELAQEVHEVVFNALTILIVAHALFHIWRHLRVKDNALRIMTPKILHRFL